MTGTSTLRFITAGSVDNGKSTLIGRLLLDSRALSDDQLREAEQSSRNRGRENLDLTFFTDGLADEREQGITIDVAYRYFSTEHRRFILADCPGHAQYTRNMITGASTADVALILVDVRSGLTDQTCRHICLSSLLGISAIVICVNKMDAVGYAESDFRSIQQSISAFTSGLSSLADVHCIPVSALEGDNVVFPSSAMPWYNGPSVLAFLDSFNLPPNYGEEPRFPVQYVIRDNEKSEAQACAGRIAGGSFRTGDEVVILPSKQRTFLNQMQLSGEVIHEAVAGMSVVFMLGNDVSIRRGDVVVKSGQIPGLSHLFQVDVCVLTESCLNAGDRYILRHTTREVMCTVESIQHRIDIKTLKSEPVSTLMLNDIGTITISLDESLPVELYRHNRQTGSVILVDASSGDTVAAGMINQLS